MPTPVLLLVDDEPEILRALTRTFRGEPYTLLTAGSADEALEVIKSNRVDVIISDFRMPGTDGIELLTGLAQSRPRMIRILISGYAEAERVLQACHGGEVDRFIPKPWETRALIGAVRNLLEADAIRERKEYLEALLESSPDAILIVDTDGRIVLANPSGVEMLGRPWDDLKQRRASVFFAGGAREYEAMQNRLAEQGRVVGHETSLTTPAGALPVSISLSSFLDGKGRVRGAVAIMKDISERKSTERALREANRQLRKANDEASRAADDLSRLYSITRRLSSVGDVDHLMEVVLPALLGDDLAHMAGLALSGGSQWRGFLYVPEGLDETLLESGIGEFTATLENISCAGGQAGPISVLHLAIEVPSHELDGRASDLRLPLSANGRMLGHLWLRQYGKDGYSANQEQFLRTVALEMGMTLNRLFEAESGERRRIQALVEGMNEPVVMFDEQFRLLCLHPGARSLLGMKEGQAELVLDRLEPPPLAALFESAARDRTKAFEEEIVLPLPTPSIYRIVITPVAREDGRLMGSVAVFHDITRWREAEQIKSEFVANVSHELRTPLTSIKEATSLLLDGVVGEVTPQQRECLQISAGECSRLARLVDDILELSRIEATRICLNRSYGSILATAQGAIESLRTSAENAGISLSLDAPESVSSLLFDPDRVTQVLVNLLGNAIKFTPRGGNVRLVIEDDADYMTARIIDDGEGIPADEVGQVFEKFYRASSAVSQAKQGTGLGLPISKALVEMHGGNIGVRSEPGTGSEFIFTLPRITARRALVDHVTTLLDRARREEQNVGLLGLLVGGTKSGAGTDPLLLERARSIIEKGLYKAQDRIFGRVSRALILVLPESDATGLAAVAKRLDGMLRKELGERYETARFRWRMAVYPTHANTAPDLLRALSRRREDPLCMEARPAP